MEQLATFHGEVVVHNVATMRLPDTQNFLAVAALGDEDVNHASNYRVLVFLDLLRRSTVDGTAGSMDDGNEGPVPDVPHTRCLAKDGTSLHPDHNMHLDIPARVKMPLVGQRHHLFSHLPACSHFVWVVEERTRT